jgi:guanylate cyclase soluble subunit beta
MHGLVFELFENWIIEQYGIETWHSAKENAYCEVKDKSFVTRTYYRDSTFFDLVATTSDLLSSSADEVLEAYGNYFVGYLFSSGYGSLLRCQGSTLRQWLSNLNAMHDHIQKSFPGGKFCPPVFWCEDCEEVEGSILLHYFSQRGTLFVPLVVGIVEELASYHFQVEVKMHRIALQDKEGSKFTSWRITAVDETQTWKLSPKVTNDQSAEEEPVSFDDAVLPAKCPFSGKQLERKVADSMGKSCPNGQKQLLRSASEMYVMRSPIEEDNQEGISMLKLRDVFPFHVMVNRDFRILQVGEKLPKVLETRRENFRGVHIQEIFKITRPVLATSWDWQSMNKLSDQHFFLAPTVMGKKAAQKAQEKVSISHGPEMISVSDSIMSFKACLVPLSGDRVMFCLCPNVSGVSELVDMGLTLSDLSLAICQRDAVFLSEYIKEAAGKAHSLDKLSRKLGAEQVRLAVEEFVHKD